MMVLGQDTSSGNLQSSELVVRNIDFLPLTILFIVGLIALMDFASTTSFAMKIVDRETGVVIVGLIAFVLFEKKFQKYEY